MELKIYYTIYIQHCIVWVEEKGPNQE